MSEESRLAKKAGKDLKVVQKVSIETKEWLRLAIVATEQVTIDRSTCA